MYEKNKGTFVSNMSVSYVHTKFYGMFTELQEKHAVSKLVDAGYMTESALAYKHDCGFGKHRYFDLDMVKINKEADKFYRPYLDEKVVVVNSGGSHITKDKLKSGSYTQEEKDKFKRQAEELEAQGEKWIF